MLSDDLKWPVRRKRESRTEREKNGKREREESEPGDARRGETREIEKECCLGSRVAAKEESGRDGQTGAWGEHSLLRPAAGGSGGSLAVQVPAAAAASAGLQRSQGHGCMEQGGLECFPTRCVFSSSPGGISQNSHPNRHGYWIIEASDGHGGATC